MCGFYRGRLVSVPESGGTPHFFTTAVEPGDDRGAIWMGGAAPAVGPNGDLWVGTGPGTEYSAKRPYDYSDAVLEISPSMHLVQFFAPAQWAVNDSDDLDMSMEPILLPDGQVVLTGKNTIVFLLNGRHLGGIGHQLAQVGPVCTTNIDGGSADVGMTVYLPCTGGTVAVKVDSSPPALHLLWTATGGGGPPIVAGGLVWTIGQNGKLYGLDPATGKIRRQTTIGVPANHFPTPGVGAGLLLAPSAQNVIAFRTSAADATRLHRQRPGRHTT
jgi:hypothetical protein